MIDDALPFKQQAARYAVTFVRAGMVVGLGHGSTAVHALRAIAERLQAGELVDVLGIPCSRTVEQDARLLGIPLTTLEEHPVIDLTIDGADEVDPDLNLIKGAGGALLREKIVAQASRREIIVVDESKWSPALGTRSVLPVEVAPFGWRTQALHLEQLGARVELRRRGTGEPFETDGGNLLLDCAFGALPDPRRLAQQLEARAGIVAHGLFLGLATDVVVAGERGIRHLKSQERNTS